MRGLGANFAEIERSHGVYLMAVSISDFGPRGGGPAVTAGRILQQHVAAAFAAQEFRRMGGEDRSSVADLVLSHLRQQEQTCSCGKAGFRDFSFGELSREGIATIEYHCVFCANKTSFKVDHGR